MSLETIRTRIKGFFRPKNKAVTAAQIFWTPDMILALVAFLVWEGAAYTFIDQPLALYMKHVDMTDQPVIDFFRKITDLGKSEWYLYPLGVITLLCGFVARGKDVPSAWKRLCSYVGVRSLFLFGTVGLSGLVVAACKPVIGRSRPLLLVRDGIFDFHHFNALGSHWNSMPSGHTTTAFALAFSLIVLYPRLRLFWLAFAVLLGTSRVMVNAHYLTDVCAGAMLGWLTVRIFLRYGIIRIWKVIFPIDTLPPTK